MQVFGPVGQQTQSIQLLASDLAPADLKGSKRLRYRSLSRLVVYAARRLAIAYFFIGLGWSIQLISWASRTVTAHRFLITVLALSAGFNFFHSSRDSWDWWQERKAGQYMARLGVKPNAVMTKSIWLKDLEDLVAETQVDRTKLGYASGAW
jgi:hypothetical protein